MAELPPDGQARVLCLGEPGLALLANQPTIGSHLYLPELMDSWVEARTLGGIPAWVDQQMALEPDAIILTYARGPRIHAELALRLIPDQGWKLWLDSSFRNPISGRNLPYLIWIRQP